MTADFTRPSRTKDDDIVLERAIEVVRDARERAPADFLVAIAVVLLALAAILLIGGAIVGGSVQDLCFNLGSEVLGAWLTVVLIDGLAAAALGEARFRTHCWAYCTAFAARRSERRASWVASAAASTRPSHALRA